MRRRAAALRSVAFAAHHRMALVAVVTAALLVPGLGAGAVASRPASGSAHAATTEVHVATAATKTAKKATKKATKAKKAAAKKAAKKTTHKVVAKKKATKKAAKKKAVKKKVTKKTTKKVVAKTTGTIGAAPGALDVRNLPTDWLGRVNGYRAAVGAPPVVALTGTSADLLAHAQYLVATGGQGHTEDPSNPNYTAAGAHGGSVSDVLTSSQPMSDAAVVDQFINAPFHAFALLDPQLSAVAFASYTNPSSTSGNDYAALLDVIDGQSGNRFLGGSQALWPSPGSVVTAVNASDEWPNPTSSCPGGAIPSSQQGTPIWAMLSQFPAGLLQSPAETTVTGATLTATGAGSVPVCLVTQDTWHASDPTADETGRTWLQLVDGAIVVPLRPLAHGTQYTVTLTGPGGVVASWSFQTA